MRAYWYAPECTKCASALTIYTGGGGRQQIIFFNESSFKQVLGI